MITEIELSYLAGIFDGEGCVSTAGGQQNMQLHCSVGNTDPKMLLPFENLWGGKITRNNIIPKPNERPFYQWHIYSQQAGIFLKEILPYLVIKHSQAALGLQLVSRPDLRLMRGHPDIRAEEWKLRSWICEKMKTLRGQSYHWEPR